MNEVVGGETTPTDGGDLVLAYERYRAEQRNGWGLIWYLAWEFCQRFFASHGIVPHVLEHEGLGYYGIRLDTAACRVNEKEITLGRFTMSRNVENWRAHSSGVPDMVQRALGGEPLPFLVRDPIRCFGLPTYPEQSHVTCRHKRWGESYLLVFQIAALLALRHEGRLRIWNHAFHTEKWGRKYDPVFGQKEHPGYFLFDPGVGRRVLIAGDGRLVLPYQGDSLWEQYMSGASLADLASKVERLLGL